MLFDGVFVSEQVLRDLRSEEKDAPLLGDIHVVQEPAAPSGIHPPHLLERRVHPLAGGVGGFLSVGERDPLHVARTDVGNKRDRAPEHLCVLLHQPDLPALWYPLELLPGLASVENHDPVAGIQQAGGNLIPQPFPEGQQHDHGRRTPGDGHQCQNGARPMGVQVAEKVSEQLKPHGCSPPVKTIRPEGIRPRPDWRPAARERAPPPAPRSPGSPPSQPALRRRSRGFPLLP